MNSADASSRRLSTIVSTLAASTREVVEMEFTGTQGHLAEFMALDSNAMRDKIGHLLSKFIPGPSSASAAMNLFAQDLSHHQKMMRQPHIFPPLVLVEPVISLL